MPAWASGFPRCRRAGRWCLDDRLVDARAEAAGEALGGGDRRRARWRNRARPRPRRRRRAPRGGDAGDQAEARAPPRRRRAARRRTPRAPCPRPCGRHIGRDGRRNQPEPGLGQAEAGGGDGDHRIADRHQPDAAAVGRAVDPADQRLAEGVQRLEHAGEPARLGDAAGSVAANCARIQSRSPPAQKLAPAPVSTTARTRRQRRAPRRRRRGRRTAAGEDVVPSGRFRVSVAMPRSSVRALMRHARSPSAALNLSRRPAPADRFSWLARTG